MNPRFALAVALFAAAPIAAAQNVSAGDREPDAVLDAILEFNQRDKSKPNEVTVVLDAVGVSPVTGKPREQSPDPKTAVAETAEADVVEEVPAEPPAGLAVRVEKLQTAKGAVDVSTIQLHAPFPAKPLAQPPAGWHLDTSESAPPFTREVEISPGSKITLTIRPHVLLPDADGADAFSVSEPGYDSAQGYHQTATVGAVLAKSLRQLDEDSQQLTSAIEGLEQLLISLPQPEPEAKTTVPTNRKR